MKILFICGSAEQGKDGVGDYTRRLCAALIQSGHEAKLLSICDLYLDKITCEIQIVEETEVTVHRIPSSTLIKQQLIWSQDIVDSFQPDWISLQFVPYSFHPKGLPYWLPKFLHRLNGVHSWHIMFHELWIGIEREATFKNKCIGKLQKRIIQKLYSTIVPKVVHTQSKIYKYYLSSITIRSHYLPLFGNVSVTDKKNIDNNKIVFVVFATIQNKAPFADFVVDLSKQLEQSNKAAKFVFIGRNGALLSTWNRILDDCSIEFEILGTCSEETISQALLNGNYGISTTPFKISDKSGVVAACREHQLPIISISKAWVDQDDIAISFADIIKYNKGNLELINSAIMENNSLSIVNKQFLNDLNFIN